MYGQTTFNTPNADIRIFVIDNVHLRENQAAVSEDLDYEVYGLAIPSSTVIANAGNPTEGIRSNQAIVDTIAHEIGHLFVGKGHPDLYNIELDLNLGGNYAGPAPLPGTDTSVRIMCGPDSRLSGARFLVKTEWDNAEGWLQSNIDDTNP